ncbi:glycosyltransferase [Paucilactobacillus sp. N302-9]
MSKKELPNFSVLMSVYFREKPEYLKQAIDSIYTQSIHPKETVIVKDGPLTVDLNKTLNRLQQDHDGIIVVTLKKNQGLGESLKVGTQFITTDYIARMDSDDISTKNRFEVQLTELQNKPDVSVLGGQLLEFVDDTKNVVGERNVPVEYSEVKTFFKYRSPVNHPTAMIRKKDLLTVGGYESFEKLEDYFLWGKFLAKGYKIENSQNVLLYMRVDKGMYSRRGGYRYFFNYCKLKNLFYRWGLINRFELIVGNFLMFLNTVIPNQLRKFVYSEVIHKKK